MNILIFIAGLALLVVGAELLVRGASKLALSFGISPLVVGLTIAASGTTIFEAMSALARAHARTGDAAEIAGYLGKSDRFDTALVEFAVRYADQNEADYALFKAAIADGRIEAQIEESASIRSGGKPEKVRG